MTIKQFIEKAIEGGWKSGSNEVNDFIRDDFSKLNDQDIAYILLDPLAWQAVGKVEGWEVWDTGELTASGNHIVRNGSTLRMHRLIDALAEGKTLEQFLESL